MIIVAGGLLLALLLALVVAVALFGVVATAVAAGVLAWLAFSGLLQLVQGRPSGAVRLALAVGLAAGWFAVAT